VGSYVMLVGSYVSGELCNVSGAVMISYLPI
jgi:hypothetical protein